MRQLKFLIYYLLLTLIWVGPLVIHAEEESIADSETTELQFILTPKIVKERQRTVTQLQRTLKKEQAKYKTRERAFQKKITSLEDVQEITTELMEEATQQREDSSRQLEELRSERHEVESNLEQQRQQLTELQAQLEKLTQLPDSEQTKEIKAKQSELKQNIALQEKFSAIEELYLALLKDRIVIALNQTVFAIDWHLQLQMKQHKQLIIERDQALASAQKTLSDQQQTLQTMQEDMPNKLTSLETTQTTVEQLEEVVEKASLEKELADVELKSLLLEHQSGEANLQKQSETLARLTEDLEALRKTPPTEPEQLPLHGTRIAELENRLHSQTKIQELEQQSLDILSQQIKQAEKQLELTAQWHSQLLPLLQVRQRQELEEKLQQEKQQYLSQAVELRWQLNKLPTSEEYALQRYLLQVKIQQANERAHQLTDQLKIRHVQEQLTHWQEQVSEEEITEFSQGQVKKFQTWLTEWNSLLHDLNTIQDLLQDRIATLDKQQQFVEKRNETLSDEQLEYNQQANQLLLELKKTLQQQASIVPPLLVKGEQLLKILEKNYEESVQLALFRQRHLPVNKAEWQTLGEELSTLPNLIWQQIQLTWLDLEQDIEKITKQRWIIIVVVGLIWFGLLWWLWLKTRTEQIFSTSGHFTEFISRFLHRNAVSIAIVGLLALLLGLMEPTWSVVAISSIILLTLFGSKWLISLFELWLIPSVLTSILQNRNTESATRMKLYSQLRWVIVFITILAAITALAHIGHEGQTLKLSLNARDIIDSFFMFCLSLTLIPLLKIRKVISMLCHGARVCIVIRMLILLFALLIGVVSILGIIGYINLGWAVAEKLSLFLLVLIGFLIARGMLNDAVKLWQEVSLKQEDYGALWAEDIIPLIDKVVGLILIVIAFIVFLQLTGWYSDIAFKHQVEQFFGFTLFSIGSTKMTIGQILFSIILLWIIFWFGGWSRGVSYRWAYANIVDSGIRHSLSVFTQYTIVLLGLLIALKGIGIDPTVLSVFAGALGVGIGFGLQNVVNNFISGILLLVERPVRTGDFIDIGNFMGTVTRIGIRSLTIETSELEEVMVPNSEVISQIFTNRTRNNNLLRHTLYIGIHYDSNVEQAKAIIREILDKTPNVLKRPAIDIYTWELTDSQVTIRFNYFVDTGRCDRFKVRSEILSQILTEFKQAGIEIPYQKELYLLGQSDEEEKALNLAPPSEKKSDLIIIPT